MFLVGDIPGVTKTTTIETERIVQKHTSMDNIKAVDCKK